MGVGEGQGLLAVVSRAVAETLGVLVGGQLTRFQDAVQVVPRSEGRKRRCDRAPVSGRELRSRNWSTLRTHLLEDFFPEPSTSCLRPSVPSCSTVWAPMGIVAALSASAGNAPETGGSRSRETLSFIDSTGSVGSAAVADWRGTERLEADMRQLGACCKKGGTGGAD